MRHSSFLEVNLGLLEENLNKIKKLTSAKIIPMVKADAYGNGLVPVSQFLAQECAVEKLGCASLGEAVHLFQSSPSLKAELLVFSDNELLNPEVRKEYLSYNITPVIHQASELNAVLGDPDFKNMPIVLKVNTGMNRLGLTLDELEKNAPKLKGRGVKHLLTHFAYSYAPLKEGDKTSRQLQEFEKAKSLLKSFGVEVEETSVSNSGAIEQGIGTEETFVRPGVMLYGPYSVDENHWDGYQISRFVSKIMKTFQVKKGTPVGYGVNVAGEDGFIAVLPIGYGDGLLTFASGTQLKVNGLPCKIFARVNMDMCFLIFDPSAEGKIRVGDQVEIWNNDNKVISDIAVQMKTIPYQLMCAVSNRIPRIYKVK